MLTYDIERLELRAAKLGLKQVDIFHRIQAFPPNQRISQATVNRIFQTRTGHPLSIQAVAKALGFQTLKSLVKVNP